MFDVAVCERLRQTFMEIFLEFPEVKCLSSTITWNGNLNDANIMHGIWLSPTGNVGSPDGIITSIEQTMKMLNEQFNRASNLVKFFSDQTRVLAEEVVRRNAELEEVKKALEAAKKQLEQDEYEVAFNKRAREGKA